MLSVYERMIFPFDGLITFSLKKEKIKGKKRLFHTILVSHSVINAASILPLSSFITQPIITTPQRCLPYSHLHAAASAKIESAAFSLII